MQLKTTYLREAKERAIRNSYFRENIYIYIYTYRNNSFYEFLIALYAIYRKPTAKKYLGIF